MRYRPEIDGLRAIAVVPVILFHAGVPLLSGGFVGVDIFFVISGYLITTIILAELEIGKFSIANFYERRARRILPALFVVLGVCLPFAWALLMPGDLTEFATSVIAVLGFASNVFFWQHSNYFDPATELKPLLHTWSLGVEEQFYILFPIFLLLAWQAGRKWILAFLVIGSLLSLALSQYGASVRPTATFFLLPTRGWELAMGSLIAFYLKDTVQGKEHDHFPLALSQMLSLAGLGLILYSIVAFDESTPFPSVYALAPTVGAALIILFAIPGTFVGRLLGQKFLVAIGLVSYSAYLWHQPLFAFTRHASLTEPNGFVMASMVVFTFVAAHVTWRYVERPFRQKDMVSKRLLWRSTVTCAFVITSCAAGLQMTAGTLDVNITNNAHKLYRTSTCMFETDQTYETLLENHCDQAPASPAQEDSEQSRTSERYVLYGDSIAAHLYPGLVSKLGEHEIIQLTGGACKAIRSGNKPRCQDFYDWFVGEYIPNNPIHSIIISSAWLSAYERLGDKEFRAKVNLLFDRLKDNRVLIYSMAASLKEDIIRYYYKLDKFGYEAPATLEMVADDLSAVNSALREEAAKFGFEFIDISQLFCSADGCLVAKDGVLYFSDDRHLTLSGSELVAESTYRLITRR